MATASVCATHFDGKEPCIEADCLQLMYLPSILMLNIQAFSPKLSCVVKAVMMIKSKTLSSYNVTLIQHDAGTHIKTSGQFSRHRSYVMGYGFDFRQKQEIFSFSKCPDRLWSLPASNSVKTATIVRCGEV